MGLNPAYPSNFGMVTISVIIGFKKKCLIILQFFKHYVYKSIYYPLNRGHEPSDPQQELPTRADPQQKLTPELTHSRSYHQS